MRMTIIRDDNLIIIDGEGYNADCSVFDDLSWIGEQYDRRTWGRFHALQWYGTEDEFGEYGDGREQPYGELEFSKPVPNLIIGNLGVFNEAQTLWESSKSAALAAAAAEEAEQLRLQEEEETRIREAYEALERETQAALEQSQAELEQSYNELEENINELLDDVDTVVSENNDENAAQLEQELEDLLADL